MAFQEASASKVNHGRTCRVTLLCASLAILRDESPRDLLASVPFASNGTQALRCCDAIFDSALCQNRSGMRHAISAAGCFVHFSNVHDFDFCLVLLTS